MCPRLKWQSTYHRDEDSLEVGFREKKYCPYMIRKSFEWAKCQYVAVTIGNAVERDKHAWIRGRGLTFPETTWRKTGE